MQVRKVLSRCNKLAVLLAITAAVLLAAPSPAAAADDDFKGWFAGLDFALTQPNGLDQIVGDFTGVQGSGLRQETLRFDNDSDSTFAIDVGYSWGKIGALKVSWWEFDNDDRFSFAADTYGFLNATVAPVFYSEYYGYGFYNTVYASNYYDIAADATSNVQATTIDVDYVRSIPVGDVFTLKWLAGLRLAEYEETQTLVASGDEYFYADYLVYLDQTSKIETDAFGVRIGVTGVMEVTDHFALEGGIAVSFMQADNDATATAIDSDFGIPTLTRENVDSTRGEIRDFHLRAVWTYARADYYIGYTSSVWSDLVNDPVGRTAFGRDERDDISFDSLNAGIRFRFGGS